jgi:hypothetical protein
LTHFKFNYYNIGFHCLCYQSLRPFGVDNIKIAIIMRILFHDENNFNHG